MISFVPGGSVYNWWLHHWSEIASSWVADWSQTRVQLLGSWGGELQHSKQFHFNLLANEHFSCVHLRFNSAFMAGEPSHSNNRSCFVPNSKLRFIRTVLKITRRLVLFCTPKSKFTKNCLSFVSPEKAGPTCKCFA